MHIVQVSTWKQACGIATYCEALTASLRSKGHNVYVLAEVPPGEVTYKSEQDVFYTWRRQTFDGRAFAQQIIKSPRKPDVVHFQHEFGLFPRQDELFKSIKLLNEAGIGCFITLHTVLRYPDRKSFWDRLTHAPITPIVHSTMGAYMCRAENVVIIPHGLTIQETYNVTDEKVHILIPGFISASKGHKELLQILQRLTSLFHTHIVGECRDQHYLHQLQEWILQMGLEDDITLDLGFKKSLDLEFRQANIVLLGAGKDSPYSASGQLHTAIGYKHLTVIAKSVPIYLGTPGVLYFRDVEEAIELINGCYLKSRPKELDKVLEERNWNKIADQHILTYNVGLADRNSRQSSSSDK